MMELAQRNNINSISQYNHTQYTYDSYGRLTVLTDGLENSETYIYDDNGFLVQKTERNGNQIVIEYNALGQELTNSVYDSYNILQIARTTTYDRHGRVLTVSEDGYTITNTYENGNLVSVAETGGILKEYTYDPYGNRLSFILKMSGTQKDNVTYLYDNAFRLTRVSESGHTTQYSYDQNGNRAWMSSSSDETAYTSYAYNDANLLTYMQSYLDYFSPDAGFVLYSFDEEHTYSYHTDGNQREKESSSCNYTGGSPVLHSTAYQYDGAGQLVYESVSHNGNYFNEHHYTYDAAGNRLSKSDYLYFTTYTYEYDKNNRLLSETYTNWFYPDTGTTNYTYDANGNTLTTGFASYGYDARNRQTSYAIGLTTSVYTYRPDGLRASKSVTKSGVTTTTHYVWDGANMVYEYDSTAPTDGMSYLYGIGLLARKNNSYASLYLFNAHGDVTRLGYTEYVYDAFGNLINSNPNDTNPFRYCGEYYDEETGTYYLRARYYNPRNGRFTQQDGWEYMDPNDPLSLNLYTYCNNNPVMYYDPSGNSLKDIIAGFVEALDDANFGGFLIYLVSKIANRSENFRAESE